MDIACLRPDRDEAARIVNATVESYIQSNRQRRLGVSTDARPDGGVAVAIADNGPGIAPEHQERIFEARFTTRKGRVEFGLGLGLPICKNIVARHGGSITVESRPGRTVFTVTLPASPHPSPESERQP